MTFLDANLPPRFVEARTRRAVLAALLLAAGCSRASESGNELAASSMTTQTPTSDSDSDPDPDSDSDDTEDADTNADPDTDDDSDSDGPASTTSGPGPLDIGDQLPSCDPWQQDCPADEKCTWQSIDGVHEALCVPLAPDAREPGEPCVTLGDPGSGYDDCALGSLCAWLDENGEGVCQPLCAGAPDDPSCPATEPASICQICPECPSLCAQTCNPLAEDCDPGYACKPNAGTFTCTPEDNLGPGGFGDPCQYSVQCQAGLACVDGALIPGCDGAGCCSPLCALDSPECPQQLTCVIWAGEVPPGPSVGVCMAP